MLFTTRPPCASIAPRTNPSCNANAARIASGWSSHSRVEPSISVNKNVTVPDNGFDTSRNATDAGDRSPEPNARRIGSATTTRKLRVVIAADRRDGGGREGAPDREHGCRWGRTIVVVRRPETRFVSVGRDRVAFQVVGEGPSDVLFLKGWAASVDAIWEHPGHLRLLRVMGANARLMMVDHRGAGMSDAVPESRIGDLDERVEDVMAVLDVIGAEQVCVCGEGDGALHRDQARSDAVPSVSTDWCCSIHGCTC